MLGRAVVDLNTLDRRSGIDQEAEHRTGLRTVGVLDASVLSGGIHADALHRQSLPIGAHIEHREIEGIGAVEIHGLWVGPGSWIAVPDEIM